MREAENIRQVAELGIDWMGFIFYHKSPRRFDIADSGQLTTNNSLSKKEDKILHSRLPILNTTLSTINNRLKKVGVFVNATPEEIMEKARCYQLDYLQLHGDESSDICYTLQKRGYSIIKAFSIATEEDLVKTREYEDKVDYFLFDTKCSGYGGSGKSFDWSILTAYNGDKPFLLSGGINPDSLEAIRNFHHPRLAGIDLNSGFEVSPGLKDADKLKIFINELKSSF